MRVIGGGLGTCTLFLLPTSTSYNLQWSCRDYLLPPCITQQNYINRLGTWNVRGINDLAKRKEMVDVFRKGKFVLLGLIETKLKGNGKISWCTVSGIIAGVQEMERDGHPVE